jgi:hypothetical protein
MHLKHRLLITTRRIFIEIFCDDGMVKMEGPYPGFFLRGVGLKA